jgi:hypothetical protein
LKPLVTGVYRLEELEQAYKRAGEAPEETMGTLIRFGAKTAAIRLTGNVDR